MGNRYACKQTFEEWCLENNRQDILDLWDYELNEVDPSEIPSGTKQKYYFICPKGIHESELKRPLTITDNPNHIVICKKCSYHNFEDLTGQIFGDLTVIGYDKIGSLERNQPYWFCKCSCDNIISVSKYKLKDNKKTICGRAGRHLIKHVDVTNQQDNITDIYSREYMDELRCSTDYKQYKQDVLKKDNFQCIVCGSHKNLEVHHIYPFAIHPHDRFNPDTGICMCKEHHSVSSPISFHSIYGRFDNTPEQLEEYVNIMRQMIGINDNFDVYSYMNDIESDDIDIDDSMLDLFE